MNEKDFKEICSIKENRHKIYKLAKEYQKGDNPPYSMCWSIDKAVQELYNKHTPFFELPSYFPEFSIYEPEEYDSSMMGHWFNPLDLQIRLDHFDKLIKATE